MVFDLEQGERYNDKVIAELQAECGALQNSLQQLKAEIRAICIEVECTSHDKFDCGMYHALRGRLRELSAV